MLKKFLVILILFAPVLSVAKDNPYFPEKPGSWVNDYANLFSADEERYLNNKLASYEDTTSTQIYLVTMNDHGDVPVELMGAEIGEEWGVGQKNTHNGLIMLIYPRDRQITLQTGYGLEEFIPDAIAKRIIEKEILPEFRNDNYLAGVDKATDVIFGLLSGRFTADEYRQQSGGGAGSGIAGLIFMIFIFSLFFGQSRRRRSTGIGRNIPFWLALTMLSGSRNTHSGNFGNFRSGGGSFGGGFGGFRGGGGGSFGGGGASGSW